MLDLLLLPFFQRALLTGIILGLLMAVLGVIVILRQLSFFSDAIGHSALTGIALGLLLSFNPFLGGLGVAIAVAITIVLLREKTRLHLDTLLGVMFPSAMALGVLLIQLLPGYQTDLLAILFGDILTVSTLDVVVSLGLALVVAGTILWRGKHFIAIALNEALAHSQGIAVRRYELLFLILLAATIAISIKLVGVILVTALVIIPAATAQNLATSLKRMFAISMIVSLLATTMGMVTSALMSTPSGPTIVLTSALLFVGSFLLSISHIKL